MPMLGAAGIGGNGGGGGRGNKAGIAEPSPGPKSPFSGKGGGTTKAASSDSVVEDEAPDKGIRGPAGQSQQ